MLLAIAGGVALSLLKMNLAEIYLSEQIKLFVGFNAQEGVLAYLLSCNPETQQKDMVQFLEDNFGRNPKYNSIIKQYCLLMKNIQRNQLQPAVATTNEHRKKKGKKGKEDVSNTNSLIVSNCDCMATKHPVWGSCLICGKIYCMQGQVHVCVFCKNTVRPCKSAETVEAEGADANTVAAYKHKVYSH